MKQCGAFNSRGHRIGETHNRARLSDEAVDAMRLIAECEGMSLARLACLFHCGKSTVRDVLTRKTRWQATAEVRLTRGVPVLAPPAVLLEHLEDDGDDGWPRPVAAPLPAVPPLDGACAGARAMELLVWFLMRTES